MSSPYHIKAEKRQWTLLTNIGECGTLVVSVVLWRSKACPSVKCKQRGIELTYFSFCFYFLDLQSAENVTKPLSAAHAFSSVLKCTCSVTKYQIALKSVLVYSTLTINSTIQNILTNVDPWPCWIWLLHC